MIDKQQLLSIPNDRLRRYATFASIASTSVLVIAKIVAWSMTDSVAMLTSLLDSGFDLIASLITAFGVASALRPPDHNHRYGHGKAEALAAMTQATIILVSSLAVAGEAVGRFAHPHEIQNQEIGYGVTLLAIAVTIALVSFQNYVVRKTSSTAIGADRLHYIGDLAVNLAVVAALILHSVTGQNWFDPTFAFGIASGLMVSAFYVIKNALNALMDAELPDAQRAHIRAIALRQPGVLGIHDMRTRSDGDRIFVDMHVEMDGQMTLRAAHDLSENLIDAIQKEIPETDIVIHQDPAGLIEDRRDTQIERRAAENG